MREFHPRAEWDVFEVRYVRFHNRVLMNIPY
jgi:hypothetical protein